MNSPSLPASSPVVPESMHREPAAQFVQWALSELDVPYETHKQELIVSLAEADRPAWSDKEHIRLALSGNPTNDQEPLAWEGQFGRWLNERLQQAGVAVHARPLQQPMAVNDVTAKLFNAYAVEGGQVHLAGCQLTDHPFLRLSFVEPGGMATEVRHIFVAPDGSSVNDKLVPQLGLDSLDPILKHPPRIDEAALRSLIAAGRRIATKQPALRDPSATTVDPFAVAVLWVRHAEGRLQFTIGQATATLTFSGWAKLLQPQPFVGKDSGVGSFKVAATDDGRIEPAEEIAVCQESKRRVLRQELVECSVTGKQALPEFTDVCPVSGRPALHAEFTACRRCRQSVSKAVLGDGACSACRSLVQVSKDDPRMAWIFDEYPKLDRWKRWRLAETQTAYIAQASRFFKRIFLVLEKESLAVRCLATAGRLSNSWIDVADGSRDEYLR